MKTIRLLLKKSLRASLSRTLDVLSQNIFFVSFVKKMCSINKPQVIVRVDGGICSQIHFYLIGQYFNERGFDVGYDLSWYEKCGKDILGVFDRNFDLAKLNPDIKISCVHKFKGFLYRTFLLADYDYFNVSYGDTSWQNLKPPVFLGGYYHDFKELYTVMLPKYFPLNVLLNSLDVDNRNLLDLINQSSQSVAVHVRRGDLAVFNDAYGVPCSDRYFYKAICHFQNIGRSFKYFVFSDEPSWVRNELLYQLPPNEDYYVVDINGSDRGYMDLILMASCSHMITSKGSLGKYAALLNSHDEKIVVINDDICEKKWLDVFPKAIEINNW